MHLFVIVQNRSVEDTERMWLWPRQQNLVPSLSPEHCIIWCLDVNCNDTTGWDGDQLWDKEGGAAADVVGYCYRKWLRRFGSVVQCEGTDCRAEPGNGSQKEREGMRVVRRSMTSRSVTEEDRGDVVLCQGKLPSSQQPLCECMRQQTGRQNIPDRILRRVYTGPPGWSTRLNQWNWLTI